MLGQYKTVRIIPAYAGSTRTLRAFFPLRRDHPRVCGEHLSLNSCWAVVRGSSPRMRGALYAHDHAEGRDGIIPAYAGSTHS